MPESEWDKMYRKIEGFSNTSIQIIWDGLRRYDPAAFYAPGISMDDWAQAIYSEMDKRGMPHISLK